MFLGLRQLAGVNLDQFEPAYAATINAKLSPLEVAGLVERSGSVVRLAPEKLTISNEVFVELLG
jgi:coproporphyrinogen III oxidase-like Fe-S oxidoreductase